MFTLFKTLSYNLTLISSLFADGIQEEVGEGLFCEAFGTGVKTYFDFVFIGYSVVFGGLPITHTC